MTKIPMTRMLWRYRDIEAVARGGAIPGWLAYAVVVIAAINFIVFAAGTVYFGGDALSGYQAGGRYFVAYRDDVTEVSQAVFEYSRWQALSLFVTNPFAAAVGWYLWKRHSRIGEAA